MVKTLRKDSKLNQGHSGRSSYWVASIHFQIKIQTYRDLLKISSSNLYRLLCCWVCVIFFACVCVGASDSTTASDDPSSSALCVMCTGAFLGGSQGGGGEGMPPLVTRSVRGSAPKFVFGPFFYF
jgi:hypothetical protein